MEPVWLFYGCLAEQNNYEQFLGGRSFVIGVTETTFCFLRRRNLQVCDLNSQQY